MQIRHLFCASVLSIALSIGAQAALAAQGGTHFLADRHVERGVACEACHGVKTPQAGATVETAQCNSCHKSLDEVAKRTAKLDPNPHYNHLVGLNCTECHRGHQKSVNMCASCHNIKFDVP